jgi:hypothetical protein
VNFSMNNSVLNVLLCVYCIIFKSHLRKKKLCTDILRRHKKIRLFKKRVPASLTPPLGENIHTFKL